MTPRFQLRRWPDDCPPLRGELAVVDAAHHDRIVRTYRDENCRERGGALAAAQADAAKWNANPPMLTPTLVPRRIRTRMLPDGTQEIWQERDGTHGTDGEVYELQDQRSLYRDFHYTGL